MRKALFLLLSLFIVFALASCSGDVANNVPQEPEETEELADTQVAFNNLGEVYKVFEAESSRFYNGQEVSQNFKDLEGNYLDLVFEAYLVAYKNFSPSIVSYVESLEAANAKRHQSYEGIEWRDDLKYVEYCFYRFKDTAKICFIEIRVFQGDFKTQYESGSDGYYAKSIRFDPLMRYDLNQKVEIATGNAINKYNPLTFQATFFKTLNTDIITPVFEDVKDHVTLYPFKSKTGKLIVREDYSNKPFVETIIVCDNGIDVSAFDGIPINSMFRNANTEVMSDAIEAGDKYVFDVSFFIDNNNNILMVDVRFLKDISAFIDDRDNRNRNYYSVSKTFKSLEDFKTAFGF